MTLPNFFLISPGKSGTTSLHNYLRQHPQVYMSPIKETNFFLLDGKKPNFKGPGDKDFINKMSIHDFEEYQAQFDGVTTETAIGESSPRYIRSEAAAEGIRRLIPHARLISVLRNPADAAYASYLWRLTDGREPASSFAEALKDGPRRFAEEWSWGDYVENGFHYKHLSYYYSRFAREQIKVYLYDEFRQNPASVIQSIFQFLEVDATFQPDISQKYNVSGVIRNPALRMLWEGSTPLREALRPLWPGALRQAAFLWITSDVIKPPFPPEVRQQLIDVYRDDILRLEQLIERDLSHWLEPEPAIAAQ